MRRSVLAATGLVVLWPVALAADKELKGSILQLDLTAKMVAIQTETGKKTFALVGPTRVLDARGAESKEGLKDKRLIAGAEVKLVLTVTGKTVREIHILGGAAEDRAGPRKDPMRLDEKGVRARVLKVDVDNRTAQVQTEAGEKLEVKIGPEARFIGPKGGVSTKGIKDDRFVAGSDVRLVMEGQTVKEVHLPFRGK